MENQLTDRYPEGITDVFQCWLSGYSFILFDVMDLASCKIGLVHKVLLCHFAFNPHFSYDVSKF